MSFMQQFFRERSDLVSNPLYIAGGSYGGIYAPRLTWAILTYNEEAKVNSSLIIINLKGVIVGNGVVDYRFDPHVTAFEMLH